MPLISGGAERGRRPFWQDAEQTNPGKRGLENENPELDPHTLDSGVQSLKSQASLINEADLN